MKGLKRLSAAILIVALFFPLGSAGAQMPAKKPLLQISVTYPGDTRETISRRAQWIEGAKKEGTLVWWGSASPAEAKRIISEFNKIYPFIKVNYWRGKGEEIAAKLEAEVAAGRFSVDSALGGEPYNYPRWRKMGILEMFTDIIPGIKKMEKRAYSKYGDWATPGQIGVAPAYNTKRVPAGEAPKSWEDLLDPKWKGHIALTADMKAWVTLALEEGGWGIEKTEDFLRKLKQQQVLWAAGHTAGNTLLISGEFKIMGESYVYQILNSKDRGAPVEWSRVRPLPVVVGSASTLLKKAPHPNAARLFLEWLFSPQGLATFEASTGKGAAAAGSGTRMARSLEGLPLVYQTEEGEIKANEMGLDKRFATILGATPE